EPGTAAVLAGTNRSPPPIRTAAISALTNGWTHTTRGTTLRIALSPLSITVLPIPPPSNLTPGKASSEGSLALEGTPRSGVEDRPEPCRSASVDDEEVV